MYKHVEAIQTLIKSKILEFQTAELDVPLTKIKKVFKGDPVLIPTSSLPALTIRATAWNITARGTQYDNRVYNVQIRYIYDIRQTFNSWDGEAVEFEKIANNIFIQEKATSWDLEDFCLAQILRKDQTLGAICKVSNDLNVNAEYTQLRGYLAYEVAATFTITNVWNR